MTQATQPDDERGQIKQFSRPSRSIFSNEPCQGWASALVIKDERGAPADPSPSAQKTNTGRRQHPFDMRAVLEFKHANTHHSSCIGAKVDTTVSLGFANEATPELLNPLTRESFLSTMIEDSLDYWQVGNGYLEVVRRGGNSITGIHHIFAPSVYVYVEDDNQNFHYEVETERGIVKMARYGEREGFMARNSIKAAADAVSEVIHFRRHSSLSRWYGVPDWLAAVPCVELVSAILQHNFDFFHNRGVPEFLAFVMGKQVDSTTWKEFCDTLRAQIGIGNSHKSMAMNLPDPDFKVQIEKLGMQETEASFQQFLDTLSLLIVSAHRTPPMLAGIQIPGKLGANNELPNALAMFQALLIGPAQTYFATTLGATLGNSSKNGGLALNGAEAFRFNNVLDHVNFDAVAGAAKSRTPIGPAKPKTAGDAAVKKEGDDHLPEEAAELIGAGMSAVVERVAGMFRHARAS